MTYIREEIDHQISDYRGILHWNSHSDGLGQSYPAMDIELFLKEHSVPFRKRKTQELNSIGMQEPVSNSEIGLQVIVEGTPDILTMTLSGFTKTPIVSGLFSPKDASGSTASVFHGLSYAEIVSHYLEGRLNLTDGYAYRRSDPDYYVSPQGHKYLNPIIAVWDSQALSNYPKLTTFSATLYLEH